MAKVKEVINQLTELLNEHGDIEIKTMVAGDVFDHVSPRVGYMLILKGRERKRRFWGKWGKEDSKGEKIIRI